MKIANHMLAAVHSFYSFTQVRFAGRYYRSAGKEDRSAGSNQIR